MLTPRRTASLSSRNRSCPAPHGFFFSSRGRHTSSPRDWSSDVCSSDLFAERCDHAEIEDRALARAQRIVAPGLAPAVLRHNALKIAVEVVGVLERAIDI